MNRFKFNATKIVFFFLFLFLSTTVFSQTFKEKQINRLYRLGVDTTGIHQTSPKDYAMLHEILRRQKQHTGTLIAGAVIGALSAYSFTAGIIMLNDNSSNIGQTGVDALAGTLMIAGGVVNAAISIPLLIVSGKRKRQRNRLIHSYQAMH